MGIAMLVKRWDVVVDHKATDPIVKMMSTIETSRYDFLSLAIKITPQVKHSE